MRLCLLLLLSISAATLTLNADQPYQVKVVLAADDSVAWNKRTLNRLEASLKEYHRSRIGPAWNLEISTQADAWHLLADEKARATFLNQQGAKPLDKLILIGLREQNGKFRATAYPYDVHFELRTPIAERSTRHAQEFPRLVFEVALETAGWWARGVRVEDDFCLLRPRAGEFALRDENLAPFDRGAVLLPIKVNLKDDKPVAPFEVADWTYLVVAANDGEIARARAISRFQNPIEMFRANPSEWFFLQMPQSGLPTQLRLTDSEGKPLPGVQAMVSQPLSSAVRPLSASNAEGEFSVPPGNSALQIVLLRQGAIPLARLPLIPGSPAERTVELELSEEGMADAVQYQAWNNRLLDLMTRAKVLAAGRNAARDDAVKAQSLESQLESLFQKEVPQLQQEIAQRQQQAAQSGGPRDQALAVALQELLDLIKDQLNSSQLR